MENKGKSRARDERKSAEPQRAQILEQGVGNGGKTSGFQRSHSERFERRSLEVGEAQRWGIEELAPPTRKAKPGVEDSVCRRIVRNARKDKKTVLFPSDLSIKSIKANKPNPTKSDQSNEAGPIQAARANRIKAN